MSNNILLWISKLNTINDSSEQINIQKKVYACLKHHRKLVLMRMGTLNLNTLYHLFFGKQQMRKTSFAYFENNQIHLYFFLFVTQILFAHFVFDAFTENRLNLCQNFLKCNKTCSVEKTVGLAYCVPKYMTSSQDSQL